VFLCVLLIAASVTSWSLVQKSPTVCVCLIVCDLETSKSGDLGSSWVVAHKIVRIFGLPLRSRRELRSSQIVGSTLSVIHDLTLTIRYRTGRISIFKQS